MIVCLGLSLSLSVSSMLYQTVHPSIMEPLVVPVETNQADPSLAHGNIHYMRSRCALTCALSGALSFALSAACEGGALKQLQY